MHICQQEKNAIKLGTPCTKNLKYIFAGRCVWVQIQYLVSLYAEVRRKICYLSIKSSPINTAIENRKPSDFSDIIYNYEILEVGLLSIKKGRGGVCVRVSIPSIITQWFFFLRFISNLPHCFAFDITNNYIPR